jgi:phytoene desaturase
VALSVAGPTVVVGAGLAGLACAIHLAAAGREVLVVEAATSPGGCCGSRELGGYRFDTGPSVLTMPEVLRATVGAAGEELDDWLPLVRLDPAYRLRFHDGSRLDVLPDAARMAAEVERLAGAEEAARYLHFREHLARMFAAEWRPFIAANQGRLRDLARPVALARLLALGGFRRLEPLVAAHLRDWRLRRAHTFQSLYVGLPPRRALGLYAVVAYMDTVAGVWFPRRGGMFGVPLALAGVASKAGATLRYGTPVERVEADGDGVARVLLGTGERVRASDVVVACDPLSMGGELLPPEAREERAWRRRPRYAPSCLLLQLGLPRRLEGQAHHTLHLGRSWEESFEAITRRGEPQPGPDPNLLVTYPIERDPEAAPPGRATLSVLEPTANLEGGRQWGARTGRLRERMLARLEALGYGDLGREREVGLLVDPPGWAAMGHSAGTPFALDHRFGQTGWLRPPNVARSVPGLVFAGMHTVPGVGVPMVLISGRLAAERVLARRARR